MFDNYATYLERLPELVAMLLLSPAVIMSQLHANPRERVQLSKLLGALRAVALTSVHVDISNRSANAPLRMVKLISEKQPHC